MATLRVGTSLHQAATNHSITLKYSYDEWEGLRIKFAKSDTKTVILKDQQRRQLQIEQFSNDCRKQLRYCDCHA